MLYIFYCTKKIKMLHYYNFFHSLILQQEIGYYDAVAHATAGCRIYGIYGAIYNGPRNYYGPF